MTKQLTIKNKVEEMSALEPFMEEVNEEFDISPDVGFQLSLALDEAVANSVNYAYAEGTEGNVILEVQKEDGELVFRLIDEGVPFDPTEESHDVDTSLSAEERPIGGLGIFLIMQMMDSVVYQREGTQNILTMRKGLGS